MKETDYIVLTESQDHEQFVRRINPDAIEIIYAWKGYMVFFDKDEATEWKSKFIRLHKILDYLVETNPSDRNAEDRARLLRRAGKLLSNVELTGSK